MQRQVQRRLAGSSSSSRQHSADLRGRWLACVVLCCSLTGAVVGQNPPGRKLPPSKHVNRPGNLEPYFRFKFLPTRAPTATAPAFPLSAAHPSLHPPLRLSYSFHFFVPLFVCEAPSRNHGYQPGVGGDSLCGYAALTAPSLRPAWPCSPRLTRLQTVPPARMLSSSSPRPPTRTL
jgi:hypothetical protein